MVLNILGLLKTYYNVKKFAAFLWESTLLCFKNFFFKVISNKAHWEWDGFIKFYKAFLKLSAISKGFITLQASELLALNDIFSFFEHM